MYETNSAPSSSWSPFLPLLLLTVSVAVLALVLVQEMKKNKNALEAQVVALQQQLPPSQHQQFVAKLSSDIQSNAPSIEQAQKVQGALQKLAIDMVHAAKDDAQIAALVQKYGIQVQEQAPAAPTPVPAPAPAPAPAPEPPAPAPAAPAPAPAQ